MVTKSKKVLKVRVPKFIINLLDKGGLLKIEVNPNQKELEQLVLYNYEHRTAEGKLRGSGKSYVDWLGNIHFIQKDEKGKKIYETIHLPDGRILKRR
jgi:hypothetical protein